MSTQTTSAETSLGGGGSRGNSDPSATTKPDEIENNNQIAANLLLGGELYSKLLGYAGRQGIAHLRDDRLWRKAMDSLPANELRALGMPVVPRPSDLDLFLLRSLLTEPVVSPRTGKGKGWKLNDLGTMIMASSPLASEQMLQSLVYPGCDEKVMSHLLVHDNKHLSASLLTKMLVSGCPPKLFERDYGDKIVTEAWWYCVTTGQFITKGIVKEEVKETPTKPKL